MAESEEEGTKEPLDNGKKGEWKNWLETQHQKTKIMASSPIISWQIEGEKVEAVTGFIFLGSKITGDGDCSHEIKIHLFLGRKAMINLDSVLKSNDITLPTNVCRVQAMVLPVVRCWTKKVWELDQKEDWAPKNWCFWICGVGEDSWESLGLQGDQTSQS